MKSHKITKFIRNNSFDYFCEDHNTSYSTKKSLQEDHDNLDESLIILIDKVKLQEKIDKLSVPSMESHTKKLLEMN